MSERIERMTLAELGDLERDGASATRFGFEIRRLRGVISNAVERLKTTSWTDGWCSGCRTQGHHTPPCPWEKLVKEAGLILDETLATPDDSAVTLPAYIFTTELHNAGWPCAQIRPFVQAAHMACDKAGGAKALGLLKTGIKLSIGANAKDGSPQVRVGIGRESEFWCVETGITAELETGLYDELSALKGRANTA